MNYPIYKIIITPCPHKVVKPLVIDVLDKKIFTNRKLNRVSIQHCKKKNELDSKLEEELTKKIRAHSPFKEVWRELIEPNFIVKQNKK